MAGILVYALHDDEGNFNKNSLGAISEAAKLAGELGAEAAAVVVGEGGSKTKVLGLNPPPAKEAGEIIEDEDTNETVEKIVAWLDERKLI